MPEDKKRRPGTHYSESELKLIRNTAMSNQEVADEIMKRFSIDRSANLIGLKRNTLGIYARKAVEARQIIDKVTDNNEGANLPITYRGATISVAPGMHISVSKAGITIK